MIHYVTVGVARQRPPTTDEYRRYAIYGGSHADAELTALQMASCTSVMPVEVVSEGEDMGACRRSGCTDTSPATPHGALGCRCWPDVDLTHPVADDAWLIDEYCPLHGLDILDIAHGQRTRTAAPPPGPGKTAPPALPGTRTDDADTEPPVDCMCEWTEKAVGTGNPACPVHYVRAILSPGKVWCGCGTEFTPTSSDPDDPVWGDLARHLMTEHDPKKEKRERRGVLATVRRWIDRTGQWVCDVIHADHE
jgi:hypothetical protein